MARIHGIEKTDALLFQETDDSDTLDHALFKHDSHHFHAESTVDIFMPFFYWGCRSTLDRERPPEVTSGHGVVRSRGGLAADAAR